jgi:hypothetical protein
VSIDCHGDGALEKLREPEGGGCGEDHVQREGYHGRVRRVELHRLQVGRGVDLGAARPLPRHPEDLPSRLPLVSLGFS